jgi:hypothetical protein
VPAARGEIPVRPTHNDAKIANVLFDEATGEALCVVDLDTVMPGLSLHDFGDLARTTVSDSEEDEPGPLARARPRPRLRGARPRLRRGCRRRPVPAERSLLVTGAEVIVYEQAIRFLGDHLDGDRYYRTDPPRPQPRPRADADRAPLGFRGAGPELRTIAASAPVPR